MPFFMWPPIVDGERNIFSPTTTNFSTIFNHFSAHILLHHTHLYVRRPQMNIFCCGWARARCWLRSLCECSCLCAFHIHNINFTLKTLFLSTLTTVFLVFLSTCHDDLVSFKPFLLGSPHQLYMNKRAYTTTCDVDSVHVCLSLEHNAEPSVGRRGFVGGRDVGFSSTLVSSISSWRV